MFIDIDDVNQMLSHVLLQDRESCKKLAKLWQEGETPKEPIVLVPTLSVNGIELPPEALEAAMQELFKQVQDHYKSKYADIESEVDKRIKLKLGAKFNSLVDKMQDLEFVLDEFIGD